MTKGGLMLMVVRKKETRVKKKIKVIKVKELKAKEIMKVKMIKKKVNMNF